MGASGCTGGGGVTSTAAGRSLWAMRSSGRGAGLHGMGASSSEAGP